MDSDLVMGSLNTCDPPNKNAPLYLEQCSDIIDYSGTWYEFDSPRPLHRIIEINTAAPDGSGLIRRD